MRVLAGLGIVAVSLVLSQAPLRAGTSPLFVSSPSTNPPTSGAQVTTGWTASPDPNVTGYFLCWGLATGKCTNLIDVGNVATTTLGGLTTNVFYYFTVVAYDAAGNRAVPSNEVQYMATNTSIVSIPVINVDLTNLTAVAGASVSLEVNASGTAPLAYQWLFNGARVVGATSNVLELIDVAASAAGQYQVVVTNSAGVATSAVATLTVTVPPSITADLVSCTVAVGSDAAFQVSVQGTAPLNYKWLFNGTNLTGVTSNPLVLSKVGQTQAGTYQVIVSNTAGTVASKVGSLTVLTPPGIAVNLNNQTVAAGSNVTFQVGVNGSAPLGYQWFFNGSAISGATSNPLLLTNVGVSKAGSYDVVVSNLVGSVTSSAANLVVLTPPSIVTDLTNQTMAVGSNVTFEAGIAGSAPFSYQWLFNGTNLAGGTTNPLLLANITLAEAGSYQLMVTNAVGMATSSAAVLSVLTPPSITDELVSQTVAEGSNVKFQVGVTGSVPLSYQWLFNNTNLPGATSNPLHLANVSYSDIGSYQVVVSNAAGATASAVASLTVLAPPMIVTDLTNQTVAVGTNASLGVEVAGSGPFTYQWLFNGTNVLSANDNPLVLSNTVSALSGTYQVIVSNQLGSAASSIAELDVLTPPTILGDPENQIAAIGSTATLQASVAGSQPLSFQWLFNGKPLTGATSNPLVVNNLTVADAGSYQLVVTNRVGSATSASAALTVSAPPTVLGDLTNEVVATGGEAVFDVKAAGSGPLSYAWWFNRTNLLSTAVNPLVLSDVGLNQEGSYQVIVSNALGMATSSVVSLRLLVPPEIMTDLTNQNATIGSDVTLQVGASGTGPLSYQWMFNGTNLIDGTVNPLVLSNVGPQQSGSYQLIVSNVVGFAVSASADLSILSPPVITTNPGSQAVPNGSSVRLYAGVAGSSPFVYQWFLNGTVLPGATSDPLILTNVQSSDAGGYQVVVSNSVGSSTSSVALVTIVAPPMLVTDLTNQTAVAGSDISFQIGVSGAAPLSYQWSFNGAVLPGQSSAVLNLSAVAAAQCGSYQVAVSNSCGMLKSSPAFLDILQAGSVRIRSLDSGSFHLTFAGVPNQIYGVQYSTNLVSAWQSLGTVTSDGGGVVSTEAVVNARFACFRFTTP